MPLGTGGGVGFVASVAIGKPQEVQSEAKMVKLPFFVVLRWMWRLWNRHESSSLKNFLHESSPFREYGQKTRQKLTKKKEERNDEGFWV